MLRNKLSFKNKQKGFTLIEILVAVAITAVIGTAISMAITQIFSVSVADKNRMEAVKQVENALHYINRDVQMTSPNNISINTEDYIIQLKWKDYTDSSALYVVQYVIDNRVLQRIETRNGNTQSTLTVAQNIDSDNSSVSFNANILTVELIAEVGEYKTAEESRTLQVIPRTNQEAW
jgi:prepilin-type N-terminal cleavage/methylation domain-containing protein